MLHIVFHPIINSLHHRLLHRTSTCTLPERSVVPLRYRFFQSAYLLYLLSSYHHLSFFSTKISLISADCLRQNCDGRLHCLLWIFWVLSVYCYHKRIFPSKKNLFRKSMDEWCNFLVSFFNFLLLFFYFLFGWCFNFSSQFFTFWLITKYTAMSIYFVYIL